MSRLSHVDDEGNARMVDVTDKPRTRRRAIARGAVRLAPDTVRMLRAGAVPKGDALGVARIAGIQAAKRTGDLIPLCHPLPISHVSVDVRVVDDGVEIESAVGITGKTGVEMEALTAVAVAALTIYDMIKAVDRAARITNIHLVHKSGGKSGLFQRAK